MKNPSSLLFPFAMVFMAGSVSGQIGMVRATVCGPAAFPSACTIPATASGNLIVIGWHVNLGASTAITISGISDNVGNAYAEAGAARAIDSSNGTVADIWYAKNTKSGATSITISPSSSIPSGTAVIWEFTGADPSAPLGQSAVLNSQPASTAPVGATVSASAGDVIVTTSVVGSSITGIYTGNPFINDSLSSGDVWAHLLVSTSGTYASQWTQPSAGTYNNSTASFKAAQSVAAAGACDLNTDGSVNVVDGQLAVNMALGITTCTASPTLAGGCNSSLVQKVMNAALGGACVPNSSGTTTHSVTLNWVASTTSGVDGYNIYRGTTSGGPYTKLTTSPVATLNYTDSAVQAGQTYYYTATAIDGSNESGYSNEAPATVPTP